MHEEENFFLTTERSIIVGEELIIQTLNKMLLSITEERKNWNRTTMMNTMNKRQTKPKERDGKDEDCLNDEEEETHLQKPRKNIDCPICHGLGNKVADHDHVFP